MQLTKEQWDNLKSEAYALERERQERIWHEQYDDSVASAIELFHRILSGEEADRGKSLEKIVNVPNYTDIYASDGNMMFLYIIFHIYRQEREQGSSCILDLASSLEEMLGLFQNVKYMIWRIEFCSELDMVSQLVNYISDVGFSTVAVKNMLMIYACHKRYVCERLAEEYLKRGQRDKALEVMKVAYKANEE